MKSPVSVFRRCCAELPGTSWLIFGGCGSAVLAAAFPGPGIGFVGVALAFGSTLIHPIGIPVTNTSVNPARGTGPALFVGGWAIERQWLFWLAPLVGAILAGRIYPALACETGHQTTPATESVR